MNKAGFYSQVEHSDMRLAIISDTHLPRGERRLPDRCLHELEAAAAIIHAGDIVTLEVLEQLRRIGPPVHAVAGNVDELPVKELLPESVELELEGVRVAVIHDAGPSRGRVARLRGRFPRAAVVVFGHSHIPLGEQNSDGFQIFNPGSPTDRRRAPRHTMGLAEVGEGSITLRHLQL